MGVPVRLIVYAGAYHAFDVPELRKPVEYFGHHLEYNRAAADQSIDALQDLPKQAGVSPRHRLRVSLRGIERLDRQLIVGMGDELFERRAFEGGRDELQPVLSGCGREIPRKRQGVATHGKSRR